MYGKSFLSVNEIQCSIIESAFTASRRAVRKCVGHLKEEEPGSHCGACSYMEIYAKSFYAACTGMSVRIITVNP
jgi:hypothetical protein